MTVQASKQLEDMLGIPLPPLPDSDDLVDALQKMRAAVGQEGADPEPWRHGAATLAYVEGIRRGRAGDHADAAAAFWEGLEWDAANTALASQLVVSLAAAGDLESAADLGLTIARHPDVVRQGVLWTFTAKVLHDLGRDDEALDLLQPLRDTSPNDRAFWELWEACGGAMDQ